jgi:hypothetical protein
MKLLLDNVAIIELFYDNQNEGLLVLSLAA